MTTSRNILFSWSGGGLPGLDIHAGIRRALDAYGIESTVNIGTSAGAIMAAVDSFGVDATETCGRLSNVTDRDVRRKRLFWKLRLFWLNSILSPLPIGDLLCDWVPEDFDQLVKPLIVCATDDLTASPVQFCDGSLHQALLASMAISGIFPPAWRGVNGPYSDGGTTQNLPLPPSLDEFDEVYLLVAARPIAYSKRRNGILSRALYNVDILLEDQTRDTIRRAKGLHPRVHVIWPPVRATRGALHFDHHLMAEAYHFTRQQIRRAQSNA